jgi:hypothetical protein
MEEMPSSTSDATCTAASSREDNLHKERSVAGSTLLFSRLSMHVHATTYTGPLAVMFDATHKHLAYTKLR